MMPNANMSVARVVRPFWRFEYFYDGAGGTLGGDHPIRLMPVNPNIPAQAGGAAPGVDQYAYDESARQNVPGYSPHLSAMLPMGAVGSTALVWVPQIPTVFEAPATWMYAFVPVWRLRTPVDWKRYKKQYNIPVERFGAVDTRPAPDEDRYIIPASRQDVVYMQPEPTFTGPPLVPGNLAFQVGYPEGLAVVHGNNSSAWYPPTGPDAAAAPDNYLESQQGVVDPGLGNQRGYQPFYKPWWLKVAGNELCFDVYKLEIPAPDATEWVYRDWEFDYINAAGPNLGYCDPAGPPEDLGFSIVFGVGAAPGAHPEWSGMHPGSGVYVMTGSAL